MIQPTTIGFSSEELIEMIHRAGLNRLNQFAAFLMNHFRNARQDPKLLTMLTSLDDVLYSGMPLPFDEEKWALESGIKLRVRIFPIIEFESVSANPPPLPTELIRQH